MFGSPRFRRVVAGGVFLIPLLAGCSRELARSLAPEPEGHGVATARGGAAMDRVGAPRSDAGRNLPPWTTILGPPASRLFIPRLRPPRTIVWTGQDSDGHIREYRYRLFGTRNPDFPHIPDFIAFLTQYPGAGDTVLSRYAPDFEGWERLRVRKGSEQDSVSYQTLDPGQHYAFAVVAIDNRGDHDRFLARGRNLLVFLADPPLGPLTELTVIGPFGEVTFPGGASVVVPAGEPVSVHWFATPGAGTVITGYLSSIDQPPVTGTPSLEDTTATIPPPTSGDERILYVDVEADSGLHALFFLRLSFTGSSNAAASRSRPLPPIPMARTPSP